MIENPKFQILDAANTSDYRVWLEYWNHWPSREIFAHPGYALLSADIGCRTLCAVAEHDGQTILYPFLLRSLASEDFCPSGLGSLTDISSFYGYGGAFQWGLRADIDSAWFWRQFTEWAQSKSVVSEVVRMSLFGEELVHYDGELQILSDNIVCRLDQPEEIIWKNFDHKVRKNVNRARTMGVTIRHDHCGERLDDFLDIYSGTMSRRNASESYSFPRNYFETIHLELDGHYHYVFAEYEGRVIACELILISAERVYSFLGGTDADAFALRPNDLLKYEVMRWAKSIGKKQYVLGGGFLPDDGIFRYKQSFAPQGVVPFRIGSKILLPKIYERLIEARRQRASDLGLAWQARKNYFPEYRA